MDRNQKLIDQSTARPLNSLPILVVSPVEASEKSLPTVLKAVHTGHKGTSVLTLPSTIK